MSKLITYEQHALTELRAWQAEPPSWGTRLLAKPSGAVSQVVQVLVPPEALRVALEGANRLALKLGSRKSLLERAGVASLEELRAQPLEVCDRLTTREIGRAMAMGGAGGAAFGIAGAFGLVADVPTLLTLAMRTIHRIGYCYGEDASAATARRLSIGIFALVSANSMDEKQAALEALQHKGGGGLVSAAWRDGVERVAERELAKEATIYSMQNLARSIGVNLGKRKAAGTIPLLGAAVGATVNAWYLMDTAKTARFVFQERWLKERHPRLRMPALMNQGV
jgi:hypothetical protein